MEDQSMLGMFENDPSSSFLEELTAPAVGPQNPGTHMPGMQAAGEQGMMGRPAQGISTSMHNNMASSMGAAQTSWNQQPQQHPQKMQHHYGNYGNYHSMGDAGGPRMQNQGNMAMGGRAMLSPSAASQQQFGSPPPGGAGPLQSPQPSGGQGGYPYMQQSGMVQPRQNTPQPSPTGMWSSGSNMQHYGQPTAASGQGSFAGHDYALPTNQTPSSGQHMTHFPNQPDQAGFGVPHQIGSPPPQNNCIGPMQPGSNNMSSMNQMQPRPMNQYGMQSANVIPMQGNTHGMRPGYNQVRGPMQPGPQMNANALQMNGNRMHFPGYSGPQGSMPRYPQDGSVQQRPQYPYGAAGSVPQVSQGTFTSQSGVQTPSQAQQHIIGQGASSLASSQASTQISTIASGPQMAMQRMPVSQSPQAFQPPPQQQKSNFIGAGDAPNRSVMNNGTPVSSSDTYMVGSNNMMRSPQQQQQQLAMEINNLQQQINQLYSMPQNPQTQQKMLDVQERMRTLKAQQQQQLMMQQRPGGMPPGPGGMPPSGSLQTGGPSSMMMQQSPNAVQGSQQAVQVSPSGGPVPATSQSSTHLSLPSTITSTSSTSTLPQSSTHPPLTSAEGSALSSSPGDADLTLPQFTQQPMLDLHSAGTATPVSNDTAEVKDELNTPATSPLNFNQDDMLVDDGKSGHQEKANRIIQEAIAKAQAEGRVVPSLVPPDTDTPIQLDDPTGEFTPGGKGKKGTGAKRERKKKEPKEPKEPKPKKPKKAKEPKEPKAKKSPGKKKKKDEEEGLEGIVIEGEQDILNVTEDGTESGEQKEPKKKIKTPARNRPKKKRTIPTFLKNKKKKRRQSSDDELRATPPPSPPEEESGIQKRRSARNTKRKKYLDDIDLELSEDEESRKRAKIEGLDADSIMAAAAAQDSMVAKPENPNDEDTLIVEKILNLRTVKRKLIVQSEEKPEALEPTPNNTEAPLLSDNPDAGITPAANANTEAFLDNTMPTIDKMQMDTSDVQFSNPSLANVHGEGAEVMKQQVKSEPAEGVSPVKETATDAVEEEIEEEEFYVKYKNFSYLHCEWRTADELERGDRRVHQKIKRYKQKRSLQIPGLFLEMDEDELFNPSYVEVDRVLDSSTTSDPTTGEPLTHYLVKWRGLSYEESTWEIAADVDKDKIEAFEKYSKVPPEDERVHLARPPASKWQKMEVSPAYKNNNRLREYQLEGVSWLSFSWYNRQNCILADEMGLGKTVQSITFLQSVFDYGIRGPFLVIAPLSTIPNWQREFELWTDMNVIVYHGTTPSRNMLQEFEMYYKDEKGKRIADVYKFHALITTYEIIISDVEELSEIEWRVTVIDEAHRLKNRNCKLLEGLRCFELEHRVLLTGTPLQNNVDELFSLLNFLEPKQFSSSETFLAEFGNLQTDTQVDKLKALLKPMMLRRLKEDVEKNLAPKEETIIEVELTNTQKKYYRAILEKNFSFLAKGSTSSNVPNLMNTMMELRKCCNHPYLINGAEEQVLEEVRQSCQPIEYGEKASLALINSSGKLVLIDKLLPKLKAGNHKVLVFSQMIRVLDILEDYLISNKYLYERLDGRIRGQLRQEAIDRFSKPDSDRFVFLLCTRAGGLGINLTAADTVIIYDSDWNPQNDLQAQARCHRIGQEKMVKVYRLITRNTYEREMFDKASLKLGLDKAVLQSMGTKDLNEKSNQMSKAEIEELLKKGAYGALMDDDSAGEKFCEENIDDILSRRTQVIQIEAAGQKGSTFSKASFNVSGSRSDINLDDPNFWQKWARQADIDVDDPGRNELIIEMPRQRKQTARYGNQDVMENMSELDSSDSDEEGRLGRMRGIRGKGRRGRRGRNDDSDGDENGGGYYSRSDCFKVEKHLLVYGWGRWSDIMARARFKHRLEESDIMLITRALLLYSLRHYAGDERIKQFIYDLVTPGEDGQEKDHKNHQGLSAPVPRGRKGKKNKEKTTQKDSAFEEVLQKLNFDPENILTDEGYKKHLKRHANKVLLRVRLLYYLKQEVIGDQAEKVFGEAPASEIDIPEPIVDGDPPAYWWDTEADRSLLIGTFKHGYEKYNSMRQDPALIFLAMCGPPDSRALAAEQNDMDDTIKDDDDDVEATPTRGRGRGRKRKGMGLLEDDDDMDSDLASTPSSTPHHFSSAKNISVGENGKLPFPLASDINTRLRRVITSYQRNHKRALMKNEQRVRRMQRRTQFEDVMKERERQRLDAQQVRWSRREEADFYRVVSTFGVERDRRTGSYIWDTFRSLGKLDRKHDETLTAYFLAFYHMCMRVCRRFKTEQEAVPPNSIPVENITEERANRCLARIELLYKIRESILWHPKLTERLRLCQHSPDLPDWWIPGEHDKELLIGAAKHGLSRTDYHILYDPKLAFRDVVSVRLAQYQETGGASLAGTLESRPDTPGTPSNHDMPDIVSSKPEPVLKSEDSKLHSTPPQLTKAPDLDEASSAPLDLCKKAPASPHEEKAEEENVKSVKEEAGEEVKEEKTDDEEGLKFSKEEGKDEPQNDENEIKEEKFEVEVKGEEEVEGQEVKVKEEMKAEEGVKMQETVTEEDTEEENPLPSLKREAITRGDEEDSSNYPSEYDANNSLMGQAWNHPAIQWPKDRVIFQRLENVCYCVEKGEWPFSRRYYPLLKEGGGSDSRSSTPVAMPQTSTTPKATPHSDYSLGPDALVDGLKMTFHKKRKRRTKAEIEADRVARLREVMGISDAESESNLSSAQTSELGEIPSFRGDSSPLVGRRGDDDSGLSGAERKESELDPRHHHRRHRRSKVDRAMEQHDVAAAAAAAMAMSSPLATSLTSSLISNPALGASSKPATPGPLQPETRVSVIRMTDGMRLSGDDAPMYKDLPRWLEEHPTFIIDRALVEDEIQNELEHAIGHRRGRRGRRPDPSKLDPEAITGDENVAVINRETGKRITGAKAPPLRYLKEWLHRNPGFDVDPKWSHIVKSRGILPDDMKSRILTPSGRGRRPASSSVSTPSFPSDLYSSSSLASLGAMASYQKQLAALQQSVNPFSSLAAMNPMYASMLASYGLMPGLDEKDVSAEAAKELEAGEHRRSRGKGEEEDKGSSSSKSSRSNAETATSASLAASLQYMYAAAGYNPLLMSQLYAQSMAAYSLPQTSTSLFSAQQLNGVAAAATPGPDSEEEEALPTKSTSPALKHSHKHMDDMHAPRDLSKPQDLSVKRRGTPSAEPEDLSQRQPTTPKDLSVKRTSRNSISDGHVSPLRDSRQTIDDSDVNDLSRVGSENKAADVSSGGELFGASPTRDLPQEKRRREGKSSRSKLEAVVAAISAKAQQQAAEHKPDGEEVDADTANS